MRGRWRLIDGRELYDLNEDPGQRQDIAASRPDMVADLRAAYDDWWELVSEQFDRDEPIALGGDDQAVKLTTHDIRNEACSAVWNQRQVRAGQVTSGYWAVDVREAGRYRVELRRWPEETGYALTAGIEGDDSGWYRAGIQPGDAPAYEGGVALALGWARLSIGGQHCQQEVDPAATGAIFEIDLAAGPDRLCASFHDHLERSIAPYYVYVQRLSG